MDMLLKMSKQHTVKSLREFKRLGEELPYLKRLPEERIKINLKFNKPLMIEENESNIGETILIIKRSEEIQNMVIEVKLIRRKLNQYLRKTFQENNNRIEQLRQRACKIKKILGPEWYKDETYKLNRYAELIKWLYPIILTDSKSAKNILIKWVSENKDLIADYVSDKKIVFGYKLSKVLEKIAAQKDLDLARFSFNRLIFALLNDLPYRRIEFDFSYLNKINLIIAEGDIPLSNKYYVIRNLTCSSLGANMDGGKIKIYNSSIESLLPNAKNLKEVFIRHCKVFDKPLSNAKGIQRKKIIDLKYFNKKSFKKGKKPILAKVMLLGGRTPMLKELIKKAISDKT